MNVNSTPNKRAQNTDSVRDYRRIRKYINNHDRGVTLFEAMYWLM